MFLIPLTLFPPLADGHIVYKGEAEGDTCQGVDAVFERDGLKESGVVGVGRP